MKNNGSGQKKLLTIQLTQLLEKNYSQFTDLQSLWVSAFGHSHQLGETIEIEPPKSQSSQKLLHTPNSEKEMDDMFLQCNKNTIYVLNSTYRYGEFDMIGLFGSPAGQALCVNKSPTSAESLKDAGKTKTANTRRTFKSENNCSSSSGGGGGGGSSSSSCRNKIIKHSSYYNNDGDRTSLNDQMMATSVNDMNIDRKNVSNFMHRTNLFVKKTNKQFWRLLDDNKSSNKNSVEDISTCSSRSNSSFGKKNKVSSKELYREAAMLLGLSCSLSDNCRCVDCQSRYFDCDDFDSDSYAEVAGLEDGEENFYSPEEEKCFGLAMTQNWDEKRYNSCDSQENLSGDNEPTNIDEHEQIAVKDEDA